MSTKKVVPARRLALQRIFESIPGVVAVYFQPPASVKIKYPCIIYNRNGGDKLLADDGTYRWMRRYSVVVVDPDPDSLIPDYVAQLPLCSSDRHYSADNLNHDTFSIYY